MGLVARVLVKIVTSLGSDTLNRSVKEYLIRIMREEPNISSKDSILAHIYALESDAAAAAAADKKEGIRQVDELVKCRVCDKKHKRKACSYKCKFCGMMGNHKEKNCWKQYPHLKKRGRENERSRSRSQSRSKFRNDRRTERRGIGTTGTMNPTGPRMIAGADLLPQRQGA